MGILEKLRPVPRWKHSDPVVRAAAVFELAPEERDSLVALARDDGDPRVRRAAVARLTDVSLLADAAQTDPDGEVRAEGVRVLAGLAAEAPSVDAARQALQSLAGLHKLKELVAVARDGRSADVRLAAVDAVSDPRSLGSISRHAPDAATRRAALQKLADPEELLNVALKSEHSDTAVRALEQISDQEALSAIGQRARSKVAARRARTRLRALQEPPVAAGPAAAPGMAPDDRAKALELIERIEGLVALAEAAEMGAALSAVRVSWAELNADVDVDAPLAQRFDAASDAVGEAMAERAREREAEDERARASAREQADRLAICDAIESLDGPDVDDRIADLKVQWDTLPPMASEYAGSLTRRFQDACRSFEERARRRRLAESASGRLGSLADELEQILAAGQGLDETLARWRPLRRDADVLREFGDTNPAASARLEQAVAALEEREQEQYRLKSRQEQENLRRLQQFCRQVEALALADAVSLKAGEKALRDIKAALEERVALPTRQDRQDVQRRLESVRTTLGPRVQELRDADEWQRWANLQVQEELCKDMESLKADERLEHAARRMRELQARWKEVALAPRAQGEALWRRFRAAQEAVFARTSTFLAEQDQARAANLARKQALCEQAEALADSTDWVKAASALQQLQAEWKSIGAVRRGHEKAVWERFRTACDRFFTRRQEDLKQRREDWSANLSRKEALCEKAEALADATDWEATASALRSLQAEWKSIGPVRRAKSEQVWQRFRGACDRFFERYKHRDQVDLHTAAAPREQVLLQLQALLPEGTPGGDPPGDLYQSVQQARTAWAGAPDLPRVVQQEMAARYHQALGRIVAAWPAAFAGTDLDPEATRDRMEKLVTRVERLATSQPALQAKLSPTELLAQQWRERLAANTMSKAAGKPPEGDDAKWRAADQEVRAAQTQWMRLGPVPPDVAGPLNERFQRACRRFYDQRRRAS